MPISLQYHVADVFTSTVFAGNQLAIIHLPNSSTLSEVQKQQIAIEFNYSESIFIRKADVLDLESEGSDAPVAYEVDIFTPQSEIPFAGHPIIGVACHVFEKLLTDKTTATLIAKAGLITISYDHSKGVAQASVPHNYHLHRNSSSLAQVESRLRTVQSGLNQQLKVHRMALVSIVKGMTFLLVELESVEVLSTIRVTSADPVSPEDLDDCWTPTLIGSLFYVMPKRGNDGVLRARQRMIALRLEDPATGSASSALACYLSLQIGGEGQRYKFELEQGVEMGRRSVIGVEVELDGEGKQVKEVVLKGQAKHVMKGELVV
ncbi:phenazine biosynthesis-like protein [Pseudovirgaria hyperparasitica]|uniref:Phenazine biosynthesis-like protein n=1 Tax=Pseudovirgaria hyperparasitica TaxID=470096 RepID=A0A6A6WMW5_9PEZI|nr:phenazine biosynthesis-like protein [Pseudovirgaria hyperparasitica]KAF2763570.1 phenazine biosynthesis-like protein [Pseudovirgaria hyperparasitica]